MAIDRKAYRADKKKHKSINKANKKAQKSADKANKRSERKIDQQERKNPRRELARSEVIPYIYDPGKKPQRSDYKGSKPQRATGSSASKRRNANMVTKMNNKGRHRGM